MGAQRGMQPMRAWGAAGAEAEEAWGWLQTPTTPQPWAALESKAKRVIHGIMQSQPGCLYNSRAISLSQRLWDSSLLTQSSRALPTLKEKSPQV